MFNVNNQEIYVKSLNVYNSRKYINKYIHWLTDLLSVYERIEKHFELVQVLKLKDWERERLKAIKNLKLNILTKPNPKQTRPLMKEHKQKMIQFKISSSIMKRLLIAFSVLIIAFAVVIIVLSVLLAQEAVKSKVCLTSSCVKAGKNIK